MQLIEQQLRVFCIWICIALNPAFCVETDSESIETISEDEAMSFPSHPLASFCYVSGTSSSIIYNLSFVCFCLCRCVYRYIVIDSLQIANCLLCFKCGIWLVWTDDVYILLLKWKCFDRRNSICQHGRGQSLRKMLKVDWFMQGKHFDWIDAHWGGHFHFLIWSWCILKRAL